MCRPSIYEFAGGEPAFLALAAAHHERCLQDPVLNHPFSHPGKPDHIQRLARYWAVVFGGPPRYSESYGDQSAVLAIHAGTGAQADMGARFVACFMQAADDAHLPDDPGFRAVLRSYMKSAAAEVMSISPMGTEVPPCLPLRLPGAQSPEAKTLSERFRQGRPLLASSSVSAPSSQRGSTYLPFRLGWLAAEVGQPAWQRGACGSRNQTTLRLLGGSEPTLS